MNGSMSLTWAAVIRSAWMPHAVAEAIRRRSSSTRSGSRAISTPPQVVSTPSFSYCRMESSVSAVISLEWSTGKMKLDACPVEPPGLGSGPLSTSTTFRQPRSAKW